MIQFHLLLCLESCGRHSFTRGPVTERVGELCLHRESPLGKVVLRVKKVPKADPRSSQTAPYATLVDAQAVSAGFVTAILSI